MSPYLRNVLLWWIDWDVLVKSHFINIAVTSHGVKKVKIFKNLRLATALLVSIGSLFLILVTSPFGEVLEKFGS